ncbi:ABC transporter permease [Defluviimonas sp. WL0024]|uniref:ABC transporter permease n=2 Tax=Albidovulum TaxID=205889 RepID=A0ABT3J810_9RHOB|nr:MULTISPECIES: ABC transporter permease [Defluviimonas]MCU9847298.1 ABC transporter permease [Defluviimonas sp. WL0024]MCW3783519.1 ABC transporter permease [Defluviimonas salinarum]
MSDTTQTGPMRAADGTPLKTSLARALRRQKLRALMLIAPLLIFVLVTFIAPIADMLFRSVENQIVSETLPNTVRALKDWDPKSEASPDEPVFAALAVDFQVAAEQKIHTKLGSRLNYEDPGISSLFRKTGRGADDIGKEFMGRFTDADKAWKDGETWAALMGSDAWLEKQAEWAAAKEDGAREPRFAPRSEAADALPLTADAYRTFARDTQATGRKGVPDTKPWPALFTALAQDLATASPEALAAVGGPSAGLLAPAATAVAGFEPFSYKETFVGIDKDWDKVSNWETIRLYSGNYTPGYFLNAVDLEKGVDGVQTRPEQQRIYLKLFWRTMWMSMLITFCCLLLGYPVAWLLANLRASTANVLMILVLLPFWTSLLVRTSAWKVLLQQQGVINDILVWLGLVDDANRLVMINNQFGTIVAMTHILLPFMILPLYSVMRTIPPSYLRAAKSLGATNWTAFWRVYFPQSVPGIGAGAILCFILAIGYYITPELVGGTQGVFISNRIAFHISSSLNWGLAAALGSILLGAVLLLYYVYDKIVGIDNVKLG